ncbi:GNAT family N-acetyltransferase [Octadecabacter ascidiaceicola]|uniref:GNAT family N-acetyltransferase n=1 Tax=Octadecabacter ascidiaceicola TaxID=1655543 RepID=UPI001FE7EEB2|nr:GNAT family protein [Octadecabacter ascidiaceicola]
MNKIERPIGHKVAFAEAEFPTDETLIGRYVRMEKIDLETHGPALWARMVGEDHLWDYLYEEVPKDEAEFFAGLRVSIGRADWSGYAVCLPDGSPVGYAFYLNIVPSMGTIEVGNINFSPALQRTPAATEAMFLMMQNAFDLGYRRYEWKCNALNAPSRRAAQRLGFSWEGIFRQHLIVKGRNRDTAWLAMTDGEWPALKAAFQTWLAPDNFDADGHQRQALRALTTPCRAASDPDQAG